MITLKRSLKRSVEQADRYYNLIISEIESPIIFIQENL